MKERRPQILHGRHADHPTSPLLSPLSNGSNWQIPVLNPDYNSDSQNKPVGTFQTIWQIASFFGKSAPVLPSLPFLFTDCCPQKNSTG
jgi:hypothetical protein